MSDQYPSVQVDPVLCRAYGLCVTAHPEVFVLPPGSPVAVVGRQIEDDEDLADVQEALRACPAQAITLVDT